MHTPLPGALVALAALAALAGAAPVLEVHPDDAALLSVQRYGDEGAATLAFRVRLPADADGSLIVGAGPAVEDAAPSASAWGARLSADTPVPFVMAPGTVVEIECEANVTGQQAGAALTASVRLAAVVSGEGTDADLVVPLRVEMAQGLLVRAGAVPLANLSAEALALWEGTDAALVPGAAPAALLEGRDAVLRVEVRPRTRPAADASLRLREPAAPGGVFEAPAEAGPAALLASSWLVGDEAAPAVLELPLPADDSADRGTVSAAALELTADAGAGAALAALFGGGALTLPVTVSDDDSAGLVLLPEGAAENASLAEGGDPLELQVRLASRPSGEVAWTVPGAPQLRAEPPRVAFGPSNWSEPVDVLVWALDDDSVEGYHLVNASTAATLEAGDDAVYAAAAAAARADAFPRLVVRVTDNDVAYESVSPSVGLDSGGTTLQFALAEPLTMVPPAGQAPPAVQCLMQDARGTAVPSEARVTGPRGVECVTAACATAFFATAPFERCLSPVTATLVVNGQRSSAGAAYTYYARPEVTRIEPRGGDARVSTLVTVFGTSFVASEDAACEFGGVVVPAEVREAANNGGASSLVCEAPRRADLLGGSRDVELRVSLDGQTWVEAEAEAEGRSYTYGDVATASADRYWTAFWVTANVVALVLLLLCVRECVGSGKVELSEDKEKEEAKPVGPRYLAEQLAEERALLLGELELVDAADTADGAVTSTTYYGGVWPAPGASGAGGGGGGGGTDDTAAGTAGGGAGDKNDAGGDDDDDEPEDLNDGGALRIDTMASGLEADGGGGGGGGGWAHDGGGDHVAVEIRTPSGAAGGGGFGALPLPSVGEADGDEFGASEADGAGGHRRHHRKKRRKKHRRKHRDRRPLAEYEDDASPVGAGSPYEGGGGGGDGGDDDGGDNASLSSLIPVAQ